jgi:hypothetical protein
VSPSSGENWGVVTNPWTRHQTWWTSISDRATGGLEITDRTPPFEPNWSTVFDRIVASSSCVASLFTDVAVLMMCSIWKDHHMTLILIFYALKFLWWLNELPWFEKSFISYIDLSWLPSFSGEWWSERAWSRLCASSSLKLQSCPDVTLNQSDTCSDFIDSQLSWYDANLIYFIIFTLIWVDRKKIKLIGKIIRRWINWINNSIIPFILMWPH